MKRIYLAWQDSAHQERLIVGELIKISDQQYSFCYLHAEDFDKAKKKGFNGYPAFSDLNRTYNINVIESFEMRLPAREREDFQKLLDRWEIKNDDISSFDLLAITGGQLPTDNFEFIDPHEESLPAEFLTELAGFVHYVDEQGLRALSIGQELRLEREPTNQYDLFAVKVYLYSRHIGYIKKGHSYTISRAIENGLKVSATIARVDANGIVNSIMLRVKISE